MMKPSTLSNVSITMKFISVLMFQGKGKPGGEHSGKNFNNHNEKQ